MNELIKLVNEPQKRSDLPKIAVGDFVEVYIKIKEGNRERVQMFDGTIIAMKNGSQISATFTVRKIASGVGVEKTFMFNSPALDRIKVVRHGRVRRAKLYYLRDRIGKAAKVKEKILARGANEASAKADKKVASAPISVPEVDAMAEVPATNEEE